MWKEFRTFLLRGNVLELAVAVILGAAFGRVITSLVEDLLMPPIGLALGGVDFTNLFVDLSGRGYATLAEATAAGAPTLRYGVFLNTVINFLIVAASIFLVVRQLSRFFPSPTPAAPITRDCPFCLSPVPLNARRCAHCTSELTPA
jgi:large conductance mechanosensitive channel